MKDPQLVGFAKSIGMPDNVIEKISPQREKHYKNFLANMQRFRLVAEVIKSEYCQTGIKVGQKIVFSGTNVDPSQSDCPLCLGALSQIMHNQSVFLDRCYQSETGEGVDAPLTGGVGCLDHGLEADGVGNVLFDVRIERIAN
jgi:uncharacterized repeat protein (TIGR04076 family)